MEDRDKTKEQLLDELESIRKRIVRLGQSESKYRHIAEEAQRSRSFLSTLSRMPPMLLRAEDELEVFRKSCTLIAELDFVKFVWIGLVEKGSFDVKPVAYAGFEPEYVHAIRVTWDDSDYGMGPTGMAIRTRQPSIMRDINDDPRYEPWRKEAVRRGYCSSMAVALSLPILHEEEEEVIGSLNVYSDRRNAFQGDEVAFLEAVARDIAVCLVTLRVQEKLRNSELSLTMIKKRLQHILDSNPAVIYSCRPEGNYTPTFVSGNIKAQLGYEPSEFLEDPEFWANHIHPEDAPRVFAELSPLFEKDYYSHIYRFQHKNGSYRWMYDELKLIRDEKGNPMEIVGYWTDLTEFKELEQTQQEMHERFRVLFEQAAESIIVVDLETGALVEFNEKAHDNLGYTRDEFSKLRIADFEVAESPEEITRHLQKIMREGADTFETKHRTKDGKIRDVQASSRSIKIKGENLVQTIWLDITARKKMEKELKKERDNARKYFDIAGVILVAIDSNQKVRLINRRGCEVLGYNQEEIVGKNWIDNFIPPRLKPDLIAVSQKLLTGDIEAFEHYENPILTRSGEERIIAWHNTLLRDDSGNVIGHLSSGEDITERKRMEEELRQSREQLRELAAHLEDTREEERTAISHEIHDELGQLLTGLKMDIMSARRRLTEDQPYLQGKMTSALSLIDETMARIRRISGELRPVLLDDLGLAPAIKLATKQFCERAGTRCTVRLEPMETSLMPNMALAIFRVFQEAITNIARHAEASEVSLKLRQRQNNIVLEVRDNGKGITEDKLNDAKSFGLQGMRERARRWGGKVDIQGTPGKGTAVILTVPIRDEGANNDKSTTG